MPGRPERIKPPKNEVLSERAKKQNAAARAKAEAEGRVAPAEKKPEPGEDLLAWLLT